MTIGIPKEIHDGELRVAATPEVVSQLIKLGFTVNVEAGAGKGANFFDEVYAQAGATVVDRKGAWASDIIMKVRAPEKDASGADELDLLRAGQTIISFLWPAQNQEMLKRLSEKKVTALAMDMVPRISRAQKMDALSSMANVSGYRAVIEAAEHFGRFFTGQVTAAGRVPPAKVMVIGAGVAGLAAIGAAKGLGAIVRSFDTRPAVKEQVESLGAEFLMLDFKEDGEGVGGYAKTMSPEFIKAEMALFAKQAKDVDIIITTALIPGKPAPKLLSAELVKSMKPGSVIVDLAAEQGGNCELTQPEKVVVAHDVTLIGYTNLPSRMAAQSSQLYGTNIRHILTDMTPKKDGVLVVNFEDEVVRGATAVKAGEITWPPPAPKLTAAPAKPAEKKAEVKTAKVPEKKSPVGTVIGVLVASAAMVGLGMVAPPVFMQHFTVFVLAVFIGYMVIWNVTPALHTPLMSITNAISSIIIIGALLQVSSPSTTIMAIAGATLAMTAINITGGFAVTRRMLEMFRK